MTDYIERSLAIQAVTRAKLPDTTPEGVPIANGKRSVTDCVRRIKEIPSADVVAASWTPATTPPVDNISLHMAVETNVWLMVLAGEPLRKINVEMTYQDLWNITKSIRGGYIPREVNDE